ncbi:MAG TPA: hypothetical protein ENJ52_06125 [Aliiroseovarius sp.]|nr:hypothetical protein [Aliiroseovarius sp.]
MPSLAPHTASPPLWRKPVALFAGIFGALTIFSGGSVLFGPDPARAMAGSIVPFVVWFNFLAGFAYVTAAWGIWTGRGWAGLLARVIATATALVALAFAVQVLRGVAFEPRTVGALALRFAIWAGIAVALARAGQQPEESA